MKATRVKKSLGLPPAPKRKGAVQSDQQKTPDPHTKPPDPRVKNSLYFSERSQQENCKKKGNGDEDAPKKSTGGMVQKKTSRQDKTSSDCNDVPKPKSGTTIGSIGDTASKKKINTPQKTHLENTDVPARPHKKKQEQENRRNANPKAKKSLVPDEDDSHDPTSSQGKTTPPHCSSIIVHCREEST